jgi:hypothetical protein
VYKLIPTLLVLLFACKPVGPKPPSVLDEEFLYWCTDDGRWSVHGEYPEKCETEVSRGEWDHLPITVNAEEDLREEVMQAVESFNSQVGFELFRYQTLSMDPDIGVVKVTDLTPWAAAEARHFGLGAEHSGLIVVQPELAVMDRDEIMLHELGHMVGTPTRQGQPGQRDVPRAKCKE